MWWGRIGLSILDHFFLIRQPWWRQTKCASFGLLITKFAPIAVRLVDFKTVSNRFTRTHHFRPENFYAQIDFKSQHISLEQLSAIETAPLCMPSHVAAFFLLQFYKRARKFIFQNIKDDLFIHCEWSVCPNINHHLNGIPLKNEWIEIKKNPWTKLSIKYHSFMQFDL